MLIGVYKIMICILWKEEFVGLLTTASRDVLRIALGSGNFLFQIVYVKREGL